MTSTICCLDADDVGIGIEDLFNADGSTPATIVANDCNGASGLSGEYALADHQINEGVDSIWTWTKGSNVLIVHIKVNTDIIVTLQDDQNVYYQESRTLIIMGDWSQTADPDLAFNGDISGVGGCSHNLACVAIHNVRESTVAWTQDSTMDGNLEVYKKELEETPTEEKYNELFTKINDWEVITMVKNGARARLIEFWNELNG